MAGSGFRDFLDGEVLTDGLVDGYLMKQAIMSFASTSARDTAITAPEQGFAAYIRSGDANEGLYFYNGTAWRKGPSWNAPWGYHGAVMGGAQAAVNGTNVVITGATVTFTAIANRIIKISGFVIVADNDLNLLTLALFKGGSLHRTLAVQQTGGETGESNTFGRVVTDTPAAGSTTYDLRMTSPAGNVNITESSIIVEDIGPAGNPA